MTTATLPATLPDTFHTSSPAPAALEVYTARALRAHLLTLRGPGIVELARRAGVSRSTVYHVRALADERRLARVGNGTVEKLARAAGLLPAAHRAG